MKFSQLKWWHFAIGIVAVALVVNMIYSFYLANKIINICEQNPESPMCSLKASADATPIPQAAIPT